MNKVTELTDTERMAEDEGNMGEVHDNLKCALKMTIKCNGEGCDCSCHAPSCSTSSPCSVFAKAFPCEEEGAIECSDCRHTHHCYMEDRRGDIRDAFLAGMNYGSNARR